MDSTVCPIEELDDGDCIAQLPRHGQRAACRSRPSLPPPSTSPPGPALTTRCVIPAARHLRHPAALSLCGLYSHLPVTGDSFLYTSKSVVFSWKGFNQELDLHIIHFHLLKCKLRALEARWETSHPFPRCSPQSSLYVIFLHTSPSQVFPRKLV